MHPMPSAQATNGAYRRILLGTVVALGGLVVLTLIMLPWRSHLSIATPALVLIFPVIIGAVIGGFTPGAVGAVAGFVLYDVFYVPPYGRLAVRDPENWVALVVYVAVALVVAQVVTQLQLAREEARRREADANRLFDLSQALIGDLTLSDLLDHIVWSIQSVFAPRWTALLVPRNGESDLEVVAHAGQALSDTEAESLVGNVGQTRSLGQPGSGVPDRISVALVASNRPVGLVVLQEVQFARQDRALIGTFANQAALAIERALLQDQAMRSRLLEEIDRWRRAMMGAVSHDLRTPLSSVKAAVSSLRRDGDAMSADDRAELLELIELQSDRLSRLVTNLLDATRIESGALEVRTAPIPFEVLLSEALDAVAGLVPDSRVVIDTADELPLLDIDHVLIAQVLANLLENAARLSPLDSLLHVAAHRATTETGASVEISVADDGPGISPGEADRVFEMFSQNDGGGRAGLGLAIAKAFVEAHGGHIWIDQRVSKGARVAFTVPAAAMTATRA